MPGPFLSGLVNLIRDYEDFWEPELKGLDCIELFHAVRPFFADPDRIDDLSYEEIEPYIKFDKFKMHFGENFDPWAISVVYQENNYNFLWHSFYQSDERSNDKIKCFSIPLATVQKVYNDLLDFLTDVGVLQSYPNLRE